MNLLFDGLGEAIRTLRLEKNLTQSQAAVRGGATTNSWSRWEVGRKPRPDMLPRILKGLECTKTELWQRKAQIEAQHYRHSGLVTKGAARLLERGEELLVRNGVPKEELLAFIRDLSKAFTEDGQQ
jgi:transcriptional regulator with XRE-family HTH domain